MSEKKMLKEPIPTLTIKGVRLIKKLIDLENEKVKASQKTIKEQLEAVSYSHQFVSFDLSADPITGTKDVMLCQKHEAGKMKDIVKLEDVYKIIDGLVDEIENRITSINNTIYEVKDNYDSTSKLEARKKELNEILVLLRRKQK